MVPYEYRLDGQDNIKNPIGMTGTRLELRANVVSGLVPHLGIYCKLAEMSNIDAVRIVPTVLASAQAVLNESRMENGVADRHRGFHNGRGGVRRVICNIFQSCQWAHRM